MNIKDVSSSGIKEINAVWLAICIGKLKILNIIDGSVGDVSLA